MQYFEITAKCEDVDENSYTNQSTGEVVTKIQLSLVVPTMRDRLLCEIPLEKAPTPDQLSKWELDESWLVVSAEGMLALAFELLYGLSSCYPNEYHGGLGIYALHSLCAFVFH